MYLSCNPINTQFDHVFAWWINDGLSGTILWVNYTEREKNNSEGSKNVTIKINSLLFKLYLRLFEHTSKWKM